MIFGCFWFFEMRAPSGDLRNGFRSVHLEYPAATYVTTSADHSHQAIHDQAFGEYLRPDVGFTSEVNFDRLNGIF